MSLGESRLLIACLERHLLGLAMSAYERLHAYWASYIIVSICRKFTVANSASSYRTSIQTQMRNSSRRRSRPSQPQRERSDKTLKSVLNRLKSPKRR